MAASALTAGLWLGLIAVVSGVYDTDILVNLTLVLANHYFSPCIKIIHKTNATEAEKRQIFHVYRNLASKMEESVGVYSYERYMSSTIGLEHQRTTCLKPMKFVIGGGESKNEFRELTRNTSMANALWLVTLNSSTSQFFAEAKIPFNTELIVSRIKSRERIELREVYRVDEGYPLRINNIGLWTTKNGLWMDEGHLYTRRNDLEGKVLRAGSIENWPMSSFKNGIWDGYYPRIWMELERLINCTTLPYRINRSVDNATGTKNSNGSWNGLVGMAVRGELDVIVSEISINDERSRVLRFSRPVLISNYQVFFCALGSNLKWSAVLHPFSVGTWLAVCAWVVVGTFGLSFCCYCVDKNNEQNEFTPANSFFFILQSLCQQVAITPSEKIVTSYLVGGQARRLGDKQRANTESPVFTHFGVQFGELIHESIRKFREFFVGLHPLKKLLAEYDGEASGMSSKRRSNFFDAALYKLANTPRQKIGTSYFIGEYPSVLQCWDVLQQGYPNIPQILSGRIIFTTSYLLSAVLIPSYSASLIYSLTHHTPNRPFDSFEEFLQKGSYDLNVIQNSAQQAYFKKSSNLLLQTVFEKMQKNKFHVKSAKEGLEKTFCLHKNQAFFGVESIVRMHLQQSFQPSCCHVMSFTKPLSPVYQCLAFLKDSPYSGLVNYKLQRLFSTGIINNIQKHFRYERHTNQAYKEVEVEIEDVFQIFVLLLFGLLLSTAFFFFERIHSRRMTKKVESYRRQAHVKGIWK